MNKTKIEWVREIVEAGIKAGIPIFLKDNLRPLIQSTSLAKHHDLWVEGFKLRQELPVIESNKELPIMSRPFHAYGEG